MRLGVPSKRSSFWLWLAVGLLVGFVLLRGLTLFFGIGEGPERPFSYRSVPFTPAESHYSTGTRGR